MVKCPDDAGLYSVSVCSLLFRLDRAGVGCGGLSPHLTNWDKDGNVFLFNDAKPIGRP